MSGDYTELTEFLENVIENQELMIPLLESTSQGIGFLICFIAVIIVIILLRYAYKFLDIFF